MAFSRDPALYCDLTEEEMADAAEGLDEFLADFQADEDASGATGTCDPLPIADVDDEDMMGWNLLEICSKDRDPPSPPSSSAASGITGPVQEPLPSTSRSVALVGSTAQTPKSGSLGREQGNPSSNLMLPPPPPPPPPPISLRPPIAVQGRAVRMATANNEGTAGGSGVLTRNAQRLLQMTRPPAAPAEVEHRQPPYRSGLGGHSKNLMGLPSFREWHSTQEGKRLGQVMEGRRKRKPTRSRTSPE